VGILAILSLFVPLVSILSGAIVGLIILTQGLLSSTRAIGVSIAGVTLVSFLITKSPELGITIGLVQWLPIMVLAEVLRRTNSLSFTLVVGMVLALLVAIVQFSLWPDSEKLWTEILLQLFQGTDQQDLDLEQIRVGLANMVHWMTILLVAVMFSTFVATLLVARWFQSKLAGSDGYRKEFYAIRLGQSVALIALLMIAASLVFKQDWILSMMSVVLATFLYQGLAIAHSWAKASGRSMMLYILYVLMIIFPQALGLTALLGVLDNWMDFRKKLKSVPE
jgi:hypothetical protein